MSSRQRSATRSGAGDSAARPAGPAWRQPPSESRASVRRKQFAVQRVEGMPTHWLASLLARAGALGQYMTWGRWAALLLLAAVGLGLSYLLTDPYFSVTEAVTTVRGNQQVSADAIYRASGIDGMNIFLIRPDVAARGIVGLPGVAAAAVHVRLPGQVIIDVAELAPFVIVQSGAETLWVASDGSRIQPAGDPPGLTLVEFSGTVWEGDGRLRPTLLRDLEVIRAARPALTHIYYGELEGLYFRAAEGQTVYLGEDGAMDRKLALLEAAQREIAERALPVQVIDVRFDGHALLR